MEPTPFQKVLDRLRNPTAILLMLCGLFALGEPSRWIYSACLLIPAGGMMLSPAMSLTRKHRWTMGLFSLLVIFFVARALHVETEHWERDNLSFSDRIHVPSGEIRHRRVTVRDDAGGILYWIDGPMAGTGTPHGAWEKTTLKPYDRSAVFYWYGEEVSEGEWHLRNR